MRYSTAFFIGSFLILQANRALISPIGVLPCDSVRLYYTLNAEQLLRAQFTPHTDSSVSARTLQRTHPVTKETGALLIKDSSITHTGFYM